MLIMTLMSESGFFGAKWIYVKWTYVWVLQKAGGSPTDGHTFMGSRRMLIISGFGQAISVGEFPAVRVQRFTGGVLRYVLRYFRSFDRSLCSILLIFGDLRRFLSFGCLCLRQTSFCLRKVFG